jgi:hypothetical protein
LRLCGRIKWLIFILSCAPTSRGGRLRSKNQYPLRGRVAVRHLDLFTKLLFITRRQGSLRRGSNTGRIKLSLQASSCPPIPNQGKPSFFSFCATFFSFRTTFFSFRRSFFSFRTTFFSFRRSFFSFRTTFFSFRRSFFSFRTTFFSFRRSFFSFRTTFFSFRRSFFYPKASFLYLRGMPIKDVGGAAPILGRFTIKGYMEIKKPEAYLPRGTLL